MAIRTGERKLHIDILRILAALLVIYNHTTGYHYYLSQYAGVRETGVYIILSVITKIAVPTFFMISGALLLGKEESYTTLFTKRIARFAIVLLCTSAVFYAVYNMRSLGVKNFIHTISIGDFFAAVISGTIRLEYWFLYAYLGFLCTLPFLRKIVQKLEWPDILMLLGGIFFIDILPRTIGITSQYLGYEQVEVTGYLSLPFKDLDILFFPLLGFYCEHKVPLEKIKSWIPCLVGLLFAGILLGTVTTIFQGVTKGFTQEYLGLCQKINTPIIYLLVKYMVSNVKEKDIVPHIQKAICTLGSLTLGVYLMDPLLHGVIFNWGYDLMANVVHPVPYSILYCFISLLVCSAITYVLKKVPVVGKLL